MRICIIGAGNVATSLGLALYRAGHTLTTVYNRSLSTAETLAMRIGAQATTDAEQIPTDCDAYLIAVKDAAIGEVYQQIRSRTTRGIVVHTAGSVSMEVFGDCEKCGVLWPVQSMTRDHAYETIPLVVSGRDAGVIAMIRDLAQTLSGDVYALDDEQRQVLHLCATIANNFSNHMYTLAEEICQKHRIPFDILKPIIRETAAKIMEMSPREAQTGAALREDSGTIQKHLELLSDEPDIRALYQLISASIASRKHRS